MWGSVQEKRSHSADLPARLAECADIRFRTLLPREQWDRLPVAVQRRFSRRLGEGELASYAGIITQCRMSVAGWVLAQMCRLIGAPLPLAVDCGLAAIVTVTEDADCGGQVWTRMYARKRGFPQVIHSAKRFGGETGLEEYLGGGFGIALTITSDNTGIKFISDHYFFQAGAWRWRLPRLFVPGLLSIGHIDRGNGSFAFTLTLDHPVLGALIHQVGHFHDQGDNHHMGCVA